MVKHSPPGRRSLRWRVIAAAVATGLVLGSVASALAGQPGHPARSDVAVLHSTADIGAAGATSLSDAPHLMDALVADQFDHPASKPVAKPAPTKHVASKPAPPKPAVRKPTPAPQHRATNVYVGRNHVWIPWLGVSRSVYPFSCTRSRPPDNFVYRWGCAGSNNVYLLGHAYSVFKGLHDAYVSGRLAVGLRVMYANSTGHVTTYRITSWRVVRPDQAAWAIASQPVPSMTLQTCVGPGGTLRLNVRLVAVR